MTCAYPDRTTYHDLDSCLPSESTYLAIFVSYSLAALPLLLWTMREATRMRNLAKRTLISCCFSISAQFFMALGQSFVLVKVKRAALGERDD